MAPLRSPVPISSPPAAGQLVEHNGKLFDTVREGRAYILISPNTRTSIDPQAKSKADDGSSLPQNVFYNPIQQFNRDLSVLAIKAFSEAFCEGRRVKHHIQGPKQQAKKERKRKRKKNSDEDECRQQAGVKQQKWEYESAVIESDRAAEVQQAADSTPGHSVSLGTIGEGDVPMTDTLDHNCGHGKVAANGQECQCLHSNGADTTDPSELKIDARTQTWQPRFRILDALSATGLRALRYATEIPFATAVTANDMDINATNSIQVNVEYNKLSHTITTNTGNAIGYMYGVAFSPADNHGQNHVNGKYEVIDLDPYGTAAPFIDSALQALNNDGLLCVTCTDSGVFASCGYSEKSFSLYGGIPVKGPHSHEGGLRLILQSIASTAAKYGLAVEPLLSLSIDFYVRLFIRVRKSPAEVKFLAGKTMMIYSCDAGCGAWSTQILGRNTQQTSKSGGEQYFFKHSIAQAPSADRLCEHCGSKTHVAGPMWAGPIHNGAFVQKILRDLQDADQDIYQTRPRIEGMLDTALEELSVVQNANNIWHLSECEDEAQEMLPKTPAETVDLNPFFFIPSALSKIIHCQAPSEAAIKGALRHAGYIATRSHCKPGSIKTNAPWSVIWEIMREWVRQKSPIKEGALREGVPGWKIMQHIRQPEQDTNGNAAIETVGDTGASNIVGDAKATNMGTRQAFSKNTKVVFDEVLGKDKHGKKLLRYQPNPRENWGPMARAKGGG